MHSKSGGSAVERNNWQDTNGELTRALIAHALERLGAESIPESIPESGGIRWVSVGDPEFQEPYGEAV